MWFCLVGYFGKKKASQQTQMELKHYSRNEKRVRYWTWRQVQTFGVYRYSLQMWTREEHAETSSLEDVPEKKRYKRLFSYFIHFLFRLDTLMCQPSMTTNPPFWIMFVQSHVHGLLGCWQNWNGRPDRIRWTQQSVQINRLQVMQTNPVLVSFYKTLYIPTVRMLSRCQNFFTNRIGVVTVLSRYSGCFRFFWSFFSWKKNRRVKYKLQNYALKFSQIFCFYYGTEKIFSTLPSILSFPSRRLTVRKSMPHYQHKPLWTPTTSHLFRTKPYCLPRFNTKHRSVLEQV